MNIGYENLKGHLYLIKSGNKTLYRNLKRNNEDNTLRNRYAFVLEHVYLNSTYEAKHKDLILKLLLKDQIFQNTDERNKFSIALITNENAAETEKNTSLNILYNNKPLKRKHLKLENSGHLFNLGEQFSRNIDSAKNSANLMTEEGVRVMDNDMVKADFSHYFRSDNRMNNSRDHVSIVVLSVILVALSILLACIAFNVFKKYNWDRSSSEVIMIMVILSILILIHIVVIAYLSTSQFCRTIETQFGVRKSECALTNRHFDSTLFSSTGPN